MYGLENGLMFWSLRALLTHTRKLPRVRRTSILDMMNTTTIGCDSLVNIIASDVPGGNRILIIKIKAQHSALSKAIKNTLFK